MGGVALRGRSGRGLAPPAPRGATTTLATAYRLRDGVTEVFPKGFLFETTTVDGGPHRAVPLTNIVLDEQIDPARGALTVWTGTTLDMATHPANCDGWNADLDGGNINGLVGSTSATNIWSHASDLGGPLCSENYHVYCFEIP